MSTQQHETAKDKRKGRKRAAPATKAPKATNPDTAAPAKPGTKGSPRARTRSAGRKPTEKAGASKKKPATETQKKGTAGSVRGQSTAMGGGVQRARHKPVAAAAPGTVERGAPTASPVPDPVLEVPVQELDSLTRIAGTAATAEGATNDQIATRAYHIWVNEGRPEGRDRLHWERAQHELALAMGA